MSIKLHISYAFFDFAIEFFTREGKFPNFVKKEKKKNIFDITKI